MEYSSIYEDFILNPIGEIDPKREAAVTKVRNIINKYLTQNGKFGTFAIMIGGHTDYVTHKQDYVTIKYSNKIADTATDVATAPLKIIPVAGGLGAGAIKGLQSAHQSKLLDRYFKNNLNIIQNKLNEEVDGFNIKISNISNVLQIEIKEYKKF